jgi:hypothetical protein
MYEFFYLIAKNKDTKGIAVIKAAYAKDKHNV